MANYVQVTIADDDIRIYKVQPNDRNLIFTAAFADPKTATAVKAMMETPVAVAGSSRSTSDIAARAKTADPRNHYTPRSRQWSQLNWGDAFRKIFAKYPDRTHLTLSELQGDIQAMYGRLSKITVKHYIELTPDTITEDGATPRVGSLASAKLYRLVNPEAATLMTPPSGQGVAST